MTSGFCAQGSGVVPRPSNVERTDSVAVGPGTANVFDTTRRSFQAAPKNHYPSGRGVRKRRRPGDMGSSEENLARGGSPFPSSDSDMEHAGRNTQGLKRKKTRPSQHGAGPSTQTAHKRFPQVSLLISASWLGFCQCQNGIVQVHAKLPLIQE